MACGTHLFILLLQDLWLLSSMGSNHVTSPVQVTRREHHLPIIPRMLNDLSLVTIYKALSFPYQIFPHSSPQVGRP
jgi:hypothetical protein